MSRKAPAAGLSCCVPGKDGLTPASLEQATHGLGMAAENRHPPETDKSRPLIVNSPIYRGAGLIDSRLDGAI